MIIINAHLYVIAHTHIHTSIAAHCQVFRNFSASSYIPIQNNIVICNQLIKKNFKFLRTIHTHTHTQTVHRIICNYIYI